MGTPSDNRSPNMSRLSLHSERDLLVKILCELRVQTILMAQASCITDDISLLRDDVMSNGNITITDV